MKIVDSCKQQKQDPIHGQDVNIYNFLFEYFI